MKRILVIDDDIRIAELVKILLVDAGYDVQIATNGQDGLKIQRKKPVDLIITDIFMPEREGTGVLVDVYDEFPETKVIVMSGGGASEEIDYLELAELLGAVKVFQKPFDLKELLETVQRII